MLSISTLPIEHRIRHPQPIFTIARGPESLATGGLNGELKLWNFRGDLLRTVRRHEGSVASVRFSRDGALLASAGDDGCVFVMSSDGTTLLHTVRHSLDATHVEWSDEALFTASLDGTIIVTNRADFSVRSTLRHPGGAVTGLAVSPNGEYLVAYAEGTLAVYRHLELLTKIASESGTILESLNSRISFSPDGKLFAVGLQFNARAPTVDIFDISSFERCFSLVGHVATSEITSFCPRFFRLPASAAAPASQGVHCVLAIASQDLSVSFWSSANPRPFLLLKNITTAPILDMFWEVANGKTCLVVCSYCGLVKRISLGASLGEPADASAVTATFLPFSLRNVAIEDGGGQKRLSGEEDRDLECSDKRGADNCTHEKRVQPSPLEIITTREEETRPEVSIGNVDRQENNGKSTTAHSSKASTVANKERITASGGANAIAVEKVKGEVCSREGVGEVTAEKQTDDRNETERAAVLVSAENGEKERDSKLIEASFPSEKTHLTDQTQCTLNDTDKPENQDTKQPVKDRNYVSDIKPKKIRPVSTSNTVEDFKAAQKEISGPAPVASTGGGRSVVLFDAALPEKLRLVRTDPFTTTVGLFTVEVDSRLSELSVKRENYLLYTLGGPVNKVCVSERLLVLYSRTLQIYSISAGVLLLPHLSVRAAFIDALESTVLCVSTAGDFWVCDIEARELLQSYATTDRNSADEADVGVQMQGQDVGDRYEGQSDASRHDKPYHCQNERLQRSGKDRHKVKRYASTRENRRKARVINGKLSKTKDLVDVRLDYRYFVVARYSTSEELYYHRELEAWVVKAPSMNSVMTKDTEWRYDRDETPRQLEAEFVAAQHAADRDGMEDALMRLVSLVVDLGHVSGSVEAILSAMLSRSRSSTARKALRKLNGVRALQRMVDRELRLLEKREGLCN